MKIDWVICTVAEQESEQQRGNCNRCSASALDKAGLDAGMTRDSSRHNNPTKDFNATGAQAHPDVRVSIGPRPKLTAWMHTSTSNRRQKRSARGSLSKNIVCTKRRTAVTHRPQEQPKLTAAKNGFA